MKHLHIFLILFIFFSTSIVVAKEARIIPEQADQKRRELIDKAAEEKAAAKEEANKTIAAIRNDRKALEKAVTELEAKKQQIEATIDSLQKTAEDNSKKEAELDQQLLETDGMIRELVGQIRINAKDLDELISQDPQYLSHQQAEEILPFLTAVAGDERFPGMNDIRAMNTALMEIIYRSGEVNLEEITIVDREGKEALAKVLLAGPFTSIYSLGKESGFLNYTPGSNKLYTLTNLPSSTIQKQINSYMDGKSISMPVDISRGGALRQISHKVNFLEQIRQGGPIVYPILALLIFGLLIALERILYLLHSRQAKPPLISYLRKLVEKRDWQACIELCGNQKWQKKPMGRVLGAGIAARNLSREDVENALHEAILAEVPKLERGLSTLGMFSTIAPLLGLLGTVTGMINVFHVITLYGASDPRMMSSGISEALVTTMLGLSVAIPLMLLHNNCSRGVDRIIDDMEEQSVALVNIIFKQRTIISKNESASC